MRAEEKTSEQIAKAAEAATTQESARDPMGRGRKGEVSLLRVNKVEKMMRNSLITSKTRGQRQQAELTDERQSTTHIQRYTH